MQDLSVAEALAQILASVSSLEAEKVDLMEGLGRILAQPVIARDTLPPFANSAMDGYAVRSADVVTASRTNPIELKVVGDIPAGVWPECEIVPGTAARITTGAPLPSGADAVVPVEETDEAWQSEHRPIPLAIQIYRGSAEGAYIRQAGENIRAGETAIPAGQRIRPQEISVLASLGITKIDVFRRPRVAILATGDELLEIDQPLKLGHIRNSNNYGLAAQITAAGGIPILLGIARDTAEDVRAHLQQGIAKRADFFVTSAGVSVGAYDVVKTVLAEGGSVNFWRVRMRPGKPLAFGHFQTIPYLGLPGNPVSSLVSFERFGRPALLKMQGYTTLERPSIVVTVQEPIRSDGRESYVRAIIQASADGYTAKTTGTQESHIATSLVKANGLVIVPEGVKFVGAGEKLSAFLLD